MSLAKDLALKVPAVRRLREQRDELAKENKALRRELVEQQYREDLKYVFIVTYGRSGSTLVQGILNSIPGYLVRGENAGVLENLVEAYVNLNERKGKIKRGSKPEDPWFGLKSYSPVEAAAGYRKLMLNVVLKPNRDTRVLGFKEIRWWKHDLTQMLAMTREIFPEARFIFNTRNTEDVIVSRWWADKDPDMARRQIAAFTTRMDEAYENLGDDIVYRIHFDDFVADPGVLSGLFDWLGEPFDRARIDEVLGTRHSY